MIELDRVWERIKQLHEARFGAVADADGLSAQGENERERFVHLSHLART